MQETEKCRKKIKKQILRSSRNEFNHLFKIKKEQKSRETIPKNKRLSFNTLIKMKKVQKIPDTIIKKAKSSLGIEENCIERTTGESDVNIFKGIFLGKICKFFSKINTS